MIYPARSRIPGLSARGTLLYGLIRTLAITSALLLPATPDALAQGDALHWTVVEEQRIEVAGAPYQVSPDGQWLAGPGAEGGTLCIWQIETLEETCSPAFTPVVAPGSIRWSPDSTAIAFGMHAPNGTMRSDIYMYELETGTYTNLTDPQPGTAVADADEAPVPHYWNPAWSPDSQHLAYTELIPDESGIKTSSLVITPRSGGEPTTTVLGASDSLLDSSPIAWQQDGSIVLTIWDSDSEDIANGIWRMTPDGGISQLLVTDETSGQWLPYLVDVSPDGARASIYSHGAYALHTVQPGTTYFLIDLAEGEATAWETLLGLDLDPEMAESPEGSGVLISAPVFSPDGSSVVFMTGMADGSVDVHVMHPDGSVERLTTIPSFEEDLAENEVFLSGAPPNLSWSDNNTVLALTRFDAVILTLDH